MSPQLGSCFRFARQPVIGGNSGWAHGVKRFHADGLNRRLGMQMKLRTLIAIAIIGGVAGGGVLILQDASRPPLPAGARADLIVVEKSRHRMSLLNDGQVLRTYSVALGRGGSEPKIQEGDARVPEGRYHIAGRNRQSAFHRSLHISYPNAKDEAAARARGVSPGGDIMIHGIKNGMGWIGSLHRLVDWTAGCVAVTDSEIEEIWRVVPNGTPVDIKP
jgi:hypothetical protein